MIFFHFSFFSFPTFCFFTLITNSVKLVIIASTRIERARVKHLIHIDVIEKEYK